MYTKKAIIDRLESDQAVIRTNDGQTLLWNINNLPPRLKEGDEVILEIKDINAATEAQQALARKVLNEIFNYEPADPKETTSI